MSRWQGRVLGGGGLMLVLAGAALGLTAGRASGEGETMMRITPGSQNVATGQTFSVQIEVLNVQNMGAYDFTLNFNTDIVEYVSTSNGTFLGSTGRQPQCSGTGAADVNTSGTLDYHCTTEGVVQNGIGKYGPDGTGTLATVSLRAKSMVGIGDIVFPASSLIEGLPPPDAVHVCGAGTCTNRTGLSSVEIGNPSTGIYFTVQNAVVGVFDPAQATPTGVPPTPTPPPAPPTPASSHDAQATVQAALGTPGRTLPRAGTPAAGTVAAASNGSNGGAANTSNDATGGDGAAGNVGGASGGRSGTNGATGANGTAPGGARGANGAPVAGYGPEPHANPWRGRALMLIALGTVVFASGVVARKHEA